MESSASKSEAEILRTLRSRFEQQGYTFIPHPTPDMVPAFLRGYQPDALALSKNKSIIIEIKSRRNNSTDQRLAQLADRVAREPDWEFQIVYAGDFSRTAYSKPDRVSVEQLLGEVIDLFNKGFYRAALLMGWAALEAMARGAALEDSESSGPMIPSQIVEQLAQLGYIDAAKARALRRLIKIRNAVAHGESDTSFEVADVVVLLETLSNLFDELYQSGQ